MSESPICVFLDRLSIDCDDLDLSALHSITQLTTYDRCTPEQVLEKTRDAEIIIVNKVKLDGSILARLTNLKLICVIATGTNNIDFPAANRLGIKVCNVRDYAAASVSQHVFMLILALFTRFAQYQSDIHRGKWQAQDQFCLLNYPTRELQGKSIGLIGYGHIAKAVEKVALAFGMQVLIAQSPVQSQPISSERLPLKDLLMQSDVVSLHCPLTDQTRNLIAAEQFGWMKQSAIIINTARGGIINEADLLDALNNKQIAGAGIDCLSTEPPLPSDPMIQNRLPQLIITPHNAWIALEARQRLVDGTTANIRAYLDNTLDQPGHSQSIAS